MRAKLKDEEVELIAFEPKTSPAGWKEKWGVFAIVEDVVFLPSMAIGLKEARAKVAAARFDLPYIETEEGAVLMRVEDLKIAAPSKSDDLEQAKKQAFVYRAKAGN
jgi:hypothetical protein